MPTNGNAGAAWAAYSARAGLDALIAMPVDAPGIAACFAAVAQLREAGWLGGGDDVVVLNTGAGLLYPDTVPVDVPVLAEDGVIPTVS